MADIDRFFRKIIEAAKTAPTWTRVDSRKLACAREERAAEAVEDRPPGIECPQALAVAQHERFVQLLRQALEVGDQRGARSPVGKGVRSFEHVRVDLLEDGEVLPS